MKIEDIHYNGIVCHNSDFPDVDTDYSDREKVKGYLIEKYGENCICSIGTIGRLKTKGVLQDLARIHNVPLEDILELTQGELKDIDKDDGEKKDLDQLCSEYHKFNELLEKYPEFKQDFIKLRGTINCWGRHAGGVLISNTPLTDILPVRVIDGNLVSCWTEGLSGRELGQMGFIKMDLLGVDAMSVFFEIADLIKKRHGKEYNYQNVPLDDKRSLQTLNNHDNLAIYQFDSDLSNRVVDQMGGVRSFDDLVALTALIRPSALQNNFPQKFKELRENPEKSNMPDFLKPFFEDSKGLPIYQESAYHIAKHLAGFDNVSAYKFMKTLYKGKMKGDAIPYWRDKFLNGCKDKIKRECIELTFDDGTKKIFELDEKVLCTDGVEHTISEILENKYEIA